MSDKPLDLDTYLESQGGKSFDVLEQKLDIYEAILAGLLRKFVVQGNKIELNLNHVYYDTYLDVTINDEDPSVVKVTWKEV